MPRPALTLLVIHHNKVARADFGSGAKPALLNVWQTDRPDVEDIGILVEVAAMQGPRLRGPVWVVWSDLVPNSLRLDARSMGLEGAELQSALAFEAEPLSGINAFESMVAYQQTSADKGEREFWVLQARRSDVELLRDTVSRLGGRFVGLTSAAAIIIPLPDLTPTSSAEELFAQWLTACAGLLMAGKAKPIAILPPPRPLTASQRGLIAVALAVFVGLGCAAHTWFVANPAAAQARAELKKIQEQAERAKGVDVQIAAAARQRDDLIQSNDGLKKSLAAVSTQRKRVGALLAYLGHHSNDDLIILKIDCPAGEPTVHGLALQPHVGSEFAHKISESALELGWQVHASKSHAKHLLQNGGPWSFELQFKDVLAVESTPAAKTPMKSARK